MRMHFCSIIAGFLMVGCAVERAPAQSSTSNKSAPASMSVNSGVLLPGEHDPLKIVQALPSRSAPTSVPLVYPLMEKSPEPPLLCRWFGWGCDEFHAEVAAARVRAAEKIIEQGDAPASRTVPIRPIRDRMN